MTALLTMLFLLYRVFSLQQRSGTSVRSCGREMSVLLRPSVLLLRASFSAAQSGSGLLDWWTLSPSYRYNDTSMLQNLLPDIFSDIEH